MLLYARYWSLSVYNAIFAAMTEKEKGKLFLIPVPLGEGSLHTVPAYVLDIIRGLDVFVVEKLRTARQFLREAGYTASFDDTLFFELNKRTEPQLIPSFLEPALQGRSIGLLSEAGAPGVADPGSRLVRLAHRREVEVIPLVGPSSILLALMSSGLNGQKFAFHGYLELKRPDLAKDLKRLENQSSRNGETQIFIETPYRNTMLFETALQALSPPTLFTVATDLTLPGQLIRTHSIAEWRRLPKPDLNRRPTVFLLQLTK
jgi:16S rRNA (cytidine1402-2'-O)-methyltransferase